MNIKGAIQKAKEKLFGKEKAADTEKPDGSRIDYAKGGFMEPSEETVVHPEVGEVIVPEEQMKRVLGKVAMEIQLPDGTTATMKQMFQGREDEERMKQIMQEFEELTPEQQAAIEEKLRALNMTVKEMAERFLTLGREIEKVVTQIIEGLKPCMKALTLAWANIMYMEEPWEAEKLKIPNNERRRRKIPIVRSRAYIQARKNSRKRKKRKG